MITASLHIYITIVDVIGEWLTLILIPAND
ncbi:MAG: hypothetical protein BACA_00737 [Bacteroides fragilis]